MNLYNCEETQRLSNAQKPAVNNSNSCERNENLFIKFKDEYVWQAINHYAACNHQIANADDQFCNYGLTEDTCLKTKIGYEEQQKRIIENIHNYFVQDQQRHVQALVEMVPSNTVSAIQNECVKGHDQQHFNLVKKLLQEWYLWDENFQDLNVDQLCEMAKDIISKQNQQLQKIGTSIETVQISQNDFLHQEQSIKTIKRHLRSSNIRSSIEHMFFKPKFIVHVGGSILDLSAEEVLAGKSIQKLDLNQDKPRWQTLLVHLPQLTAFAGIAVYGNKVFISGGRNPSASYLLCWETKTIVYNTAFMLTLHNDNLETLHPMGDSRSHHGFVTFKGSIWAIGGSNGIHSLSTVESFDPISHRWSKRSSLQQARSGSAVVVHGNQIWVIGGRTTNGDILSSVEIYDCKEKEWHYSCNIPKPLLLSAAVSTLGQLFVVGGLTGTKNFPIAEAIIYRWDCSTRSWKIWNRMKEARINHSVTRYGNYISINGGHGLVNGVPIHLRGSICFDVTQCEKEIYTPKLGTQRIGVGIAMVGNSAVFDDIISKTKSLKEKSSDCVSCIGSFVCGKKSLNGRQQNKKNSSKNSSDISFEVKKRHGMSYFN